MPFERLLVLQLVIAAGCLWLGFLLHGTPAGAAEPAAPLAGLLLAAAAIWPACRRGVVCLLPALALMYLVTRCMSAGWWSDAWFMPAVLACAALAVGLHRGGSHWFR